MGKVKDKLLELEEEGIIVWSTEKECYVQSDIQEPIPFDLAQYLFERHQHEAEEAQIESTDEAMDDLTQENFWS